MIFDPMYFLIVGPGILLAAWATFKVKSAFARGSRIALRSGVSGAEAAAHILQSNGLHNVRIEPTRAHLGDHYDPRSKVLRLSPEVYGGRSAASVGVAAHEVGHALQDARGYAPLSLRNAIVPMASFGSNAALLIFIVGIFLNMASLIWAAIIVFSAVVAFQLINLPVEFNASSRAREALIDSGIVAEQEDRAVGKVLNAAAMTYVAATLTAVLTLLYFIMRARD
ncbi:MAG: zinc metallopeptidase [Phycisphaerales bacterium]|nr:MAG: zinc metallopeptidase [Phycisphaerales bacterium]